MLIKCPQCKNEAEENTRCPHCGYPLPTFKYADRRGSFGSTMSLGCLLIFASVFAFFIFMIVGYILKIHHHFPQ